MRCGTVNIGYRRDGESATFGIARTECVDFEDLSGNEFPFAPERSAALEVNYDPGNGFFPNANLTVDLHARLSQVPAIFAPNTDPAPQQIYISGSRTSSKMGGSAINANPGSVFGARQQR